MQYVTAAKAVRTRERAASDIPPVSGASFGGFLANRVENMAYYSELARSAPIASFEGGRYSLVESRGFPGLVLLDHREKAVDYALAWDTVLIDGIICAASFREWRGPYAYSYARAHAGMSFSMHVMTEILASSIPLLFTDKSRFFTYRISRAMDLGMKVYLIDIGQKPRLLTREDIDAHITWRSDTPIPSHDRMCVISSRDLW